MERSQPKFVIGQKVKDIHTGKVKTIQAVVLDDFLESKWFYSFDSLGWYLVPEEDLEAV